MPSATLPMPSGCGCRWRRIWRRWLAVTKVVLDHPRRGAADQPQRVRVSAALVAGNIEYPPAGPL